MNGWVSHQHLHIFQFSKVKSFEWYICCISWFFIVDSLVPPGSIFTFVAYMSHMTVIDRIPKSTVVYEWKQLRLDYHLPLHSNPELCAFRRFRSRHVWKNTVKTEVDDSAGVWTVECRTNTCTFFNSPKSSLSNDIYVVSVDFLSLTRSYPLGQFSLSLHTWVTWPSLTGYQNRQLCMSENNFVWTIIYPYIQILNCVRSEDFVVGTSEKTQWKPKLMTVLVCERLSVAPTPAHFSILQSQVFRMIYMLYQLIFYRWLARTPWVNFHFRCIHESHDRHWPDTKIDSCVWVKTTSFGLSFTPTFKSWIVCVQKIS